MLNQNISIYSKLYEQYLLADQAAQPDEAVFIISTKSKGFVTKTFAANDFTPAIIKLIQLSQQKLNKELIGEMDELKDDFRQIHSRQVIKHKEQKTFAPLILTDMRYRVEQLVNNREIEQANALIQSSQSIKAILKYRLGIDPQLMDPLNIVGEYLSNDPTTMENMGKVIQSTKARFDFMESNQELYLKYLLREIKSSGKTCKEVLQKYPYPFSHLNLLDIVKLGFSKEQIEILIQNSPCISEMTINCNIQLYETVFDSLIALTIIGDTAITDDMLQKFFKRTTKLQTFKIMFFDNSRSPLKLTNCVFPSSLRKIDIYQRAVDNSTFQNSIQNCTQLEVVKLNGTNISLEGVSFPPSLKYIYIYVARENIHFMESIRNCNQLQYFDLSGTSINFKGFSFPPTLKGFHLTTKDTDNIDFARSIQNCPLLEEVSLNGSNITLENICFSDKLEYLALSECPVDDNNLINALKNSNKLRFLNIEHTFISLENWTVPATLEMLVTDDELSHETLTKILSQTKLIGLQTRYSGHNLRLPATLQYLDVSYDKELTRDMLLEMVQDCKKLAAINRDKCTSLELEDDDLLGVVLDDDLYLRQYFRFTSDFGKF